MSFTNLKNKSTLASFNKCSEYAFYTSKTSGTPIRVLCVPRFSIEYAGNTFNSFVPEDSVSFDFLRSDIGKPSKGDKIRYNNNLYSVRGESNVGSDELIVRVMVNDG